MKLHERKPSANQKPVLLELGGKAPLIDLEDADLDVAVDATVFEAFANSGQICMSTERVIIDERVANRFTEKLARRVAALPTGDAQKGDVVLGSVVGRDTVDRKARRLALRCSRRGASAKEFGVLAPIFHRCEARNQASYRARRVMTGSTLSPGRRFSSVT